MFDDDESPIPPREKNPGRSTGPTSPEGKSRSSLNRVTHGCRSEQLLLPNEDPAEFDFLVNHWFDSYNPEDPLAESLVEEVAHAAWFLKRAEKWLRQVQVRLPQDAWLWTDDNHKILGNALRYKTSAERTFFRWYKAVEAHYDREFRRHELAERARAAALNIKWLDRLEQETAEKLKLKQYAQIFGDDEVCSTVLVPSNDQIKADAAARPEPPQLITRLLYFTNGVPAAYDWLNPTPAQCGCETVGSQTMLYEDWLKHIESERNAPDGHLIPSFTALLPAKTRRPVPPPPSTALE